MALDKSYGIALGWPLGAGQAIITFQGSFGLSSSTLPESSGFGTFIGTLAALAPGKSLAFTSNDPRFQIGGPDSNQVLLAPGYRLSSGQTFTPTFTVLDNLGNTASVTPTISVTAATNPGQLTSTTGSALVPAIGFEARLGVGAAFGATSGVTLQGGASINAGAGPAGQDTVLLPAGGYLSATATGALGAFTAVMVIKPTNKVNHGLAGLSGSGNNAINLIQLQTDVGSTNYYDSKLILVGSTAGGTAKTSTARFERQGRWQIVCVTFDGTTTNGYIDDPATVNTGWTDGTGNTGKTFTFDQLIKLGATSPILTGEIAACYIYGAALNATDRASLFAWLEPERRHPVYVRTTGADSTADATKLASPYASFAQAIQYARPGDEFRLVGTFNGQALAPTLSGASGSPIVWRGWGSDDKPGLFAIDYAVASALTWTNTTGDTWTAPYATGEPASFLWLTGTPGTLTEFTKLLDNTAAGTVAVGQYTWVSNVLTANLGPGVNPNAQTIILTAPTGSAVDGIGGQSTYTTFRDGRVRYAPRDGVRYGSNAANTLCQNLEIAWNSEDGFGPASSFTTNDLYNSIVRRNGPSLPYALNSGKGDGIAHHGGSGGKVVNCLIEGNETGGPRSEQFSTTLLDRCTIRGNYGTDVQQAQQSSGGSAGNLQLTNCIIEVQDGNVNGYAIEVQTGATSVQLKVRNCTIVNKKGAGASRAIKTDTGIMTPDVSFNIIDGFPTGAIVATGTTLTGDYNDFFNVSGTPTTGYTGGGHDITTNPLFTNRAGGDYSLQTGSPALATAVGSAQTLNVLSRQRQAAAVNIGAF